MAKVDIRNLCPYCMSDKSSPSAKCPVCGYDPKKNEYSPRCIKPMTVLGNNYLVGGVLGEGGFGITYIGWDMAAGERVAIKEYFPSSLAVRDTTTGISNMVHSISGEKKVFFENGMKKFEDEARNLIKLQKLEGIVSFRNFFKENDTAYIVMDYVDGIDLKHFLQQNGNCLEEKQVLEMMQPLMRSLSKVHATGLVHRDISPDNIMIKSDGSVVLIDFGAARVATGEETQSLTVILKHGYAPEEQYRTRGRQGPFTDVYAMSAVIYKLLTGVTPDDAMERCIEDKLLPLSEYPQKISLNTSLTISKGMAVKAKDRFQNMDEFLEALYNNAAPPLQESPRKRPFVKWLVLGIGIAGLLGVGALSMSRNQLTVDYSAETSPVIEDAEAGEETASMSEIAAVTEVTPEPTVEPTPVATPSPTPIVDYSYLTYEETEDGEGIIITGRCKSVQMLNIPSEIDGKPVVEIADYAFACQGAETVDEPSEDDYIIEGLSDTADITAVVFPETLKVIGECAFGSCLSLRSISIPEGVTEIGDGAFCYCSAAEKLTLPSTLKTIGNEAFAGCFSLEYVSVPDGCISIGESAFYDCIFLKSINVPASVESIGGDAFSECLSLTVRCPEGSYTEEYMGQGDIPYVTY